MGAVLRGSGRVRLRDSLSLCSSEADVGNASGRNRCGASGFAACSSRSGCCVESGHEFAVGGAGCGEVFVAFVELLLQVEVVLFELVDALVECVDVGRGAEPGLAPGLFAERLRTAVSRVGWMRALSRAARSWAASRSACSEARVTAGPVCSVQDWICLQRMDFLQQVAMPVEESAVDPSSASDGGSADRLTVGRCLVEGPR